MRGKEPIWPIKSGAGFRACLSENKIKFVNLSKNFVCILKLIGIYTFSVKQIASSSNGRTADSDSVNRGSNPCEAAIKKNTLTGVFLFAGKCL